MIILVNIPILCKNKQLLLTIKGVGDVVAHEMVFLFAAKSFTHAKQVAAYLGLIPKLNESGVFNKNQALFGSGRSHEKIGTDLFWCG